MKKYFLIYFTFLSVSLFAQKNDIEKIYVLIDESEYGELFEFKKQDGESASIKILYYAKRNQGFSKREQTNKNNVVVNPEPSSNYYEFISIKKKQTIKSINNLISFSIEDISKNSKNVLKEFPYTVVFIEKVRCGIYNLWEMNLVMNE